MLPRRSTFDKKYVCHHAKMSPCINKSKWRSNDCFELPMLNIKSYDQKNLFWTISLKCICTLSQNLLICAKQYSLKYIDQDPRAPRPYLFSDAQNAYDSVVLVYTISVYMLASLGQRPILRYEVRQVSKNLANFTYILIAHFYICYTQYC